MGREDVGELVRVIGLEGGENPFGREMVRELGVLLEELGQLRHVPAQRLILANLDRLDLDSRHQTIGVGNDLDEPRSLEPFDHHLDVARGELKVLHHPGDHSEFVDIGEHRVRRSSDRVGWRERASYRVVRGLAPGPPPMVFGRPRMAPSCAERRPCPAAERWRASGFHGLLSSCVLSFWGSVGPAESVAGGASVRCRISLPFSQPEVAQLDARPHPAVITNSLRSGSAGI